MTESSVTVAPTVTISKQLYLLKAVDVFFIDRAYSSSKLKSILPELDAQEMEELSEFHLRVFSALWAKDFHSFNVRDHNYYMYNYAVHVIVNNLINSSPYSNQLLLNNVPDYIKDFISYSHANSGDDAKRVGKYHELKKRVIQKSSQLLSYTSAHKRALEGACSDFFATNSVQTDFSPRELPTLHEEFHLFYHDNNSRTCYKERENNAGIKLLYEGVGNYNTSSYYNMTHNYEKHCLTHPLCAMSYSFSKATEDLYYHKNKNRLSADNRNKRMFVAYDGFDSAQDYVDNSFVFNTTIMLVDKILLVQSQLVVLNPRSTFSWEIFVVRTALGLSSYPMVRNNDFYFQNLRGSGKNRTVSWDRVIKAYQSIIIQIK